MLNRFERLPSIAAAAGVAVGLLIANGVHDWLEAKRVGSGALVVSDLVCVLIALVLVRFLAEQALYNWRWLRRLVLGRQHVEGCWLDVVTHSDGSQRFGIVRFEPDKNSLRYGGENYTPDGKPIGDFDTDVVAMDWPMLRFAYRAFDGTEAQGRAGRTGDAFLNGFGDLRFNELDGRPTTYSGRCIDATQGAHSIQGWRIERERDLRRLGTRAGRAALIRDAAGADGDARAELGRADRRGSR